MTTDPRPPLRGRFAEPVKSLSAERFKALRREALAPWPLRIGLGRRISSGVLAVVFLAIWYGTLTGFRHGPNADPASFRFWLDPLVAFLCPLAVVVCARVAITGRQFYGLSPTW